MKANHTHFLILHLFSLCCITLNLLTGLRIRIVSDNSLLWLSAFLPQGVLHQIHIYSAIGLSAAVAASSVYLFKRKTVLTSTYHQWVNRFGYAVILGLLLTGWLKYFQPSVLIPADLHYLFSLLLVLYVGLHSYVYIMQLGLKVFNAIMPRNNFGWSWLLPLFIVFITAFSIVEQQVNSRQLKVLEIAYEQLIDIDGEANEAFWQNAQRVVINTSGGANFVDGQTQVTVQAAANPLEVYFLFRWHDPTQSIQHMPMRKQDKQWVIQQDGFQTFDEQTYYEDKFAVMLSNSCDYGADGSAHLGPQPFADKPRNFHGKGYHAAFDGAVRDLWHWKAVRTNDMFLADDNHITKARVSRTGERRYTAGYGADAKESGAYVMNWQWYKQAQVIPKRLPIKRELLTEYQDVNKTWLMAWFDTQPYQAKQDNYPDGSLLPSVLYRSNRFEGDRADIRARGKWHNGYWTLELSRKRNTESELDVLLKDSVCLWVSAFDHSQIAHTRHERPLKLVFDQ